ARRGPRADEGAVERVREGQHPGEHRVARAGAGRAAREESREGGEAGRGAVQGDGEGHPARSRRTRRGGRERDRLSRLGRGELRDRLFDQSRRGCVGSAVGREELMTASRSAVDISTLQKFLETVGSYTEDLIFAPGIVNVIHHYTDLKGLQGIVENHDLWLTNSRYSNDDEELMHGYRIVREVINTELASTPDDLFKDYLRQVLAILESPAPEGVYICCFCQDGDLLSQWRGYGSNGTGVSLAFLASGFSYVTGPDSPPRGLVRPWRGLLLPSTPTDP